MKKVAHIINPVNAPDSSDLFIAQPITFESFKKAKEYTTSINVSQITTQYEEDKSIIPPHLTVTPNLERSILDILTVEKRRKLPFIGDIINRLINFDDSEYLVYSNVDIAIQPYFYEFINTQFESGLDAFVINRRTIPKELNKISMLSEMYACIGEKHPGYDCFCMKRTIAEKIILADVILGANWIGRALISNLSCLTDNFKIFENESLTFHIGDDLSWRNPSFKPYDEHNKNECIKIISKLRGDLTNQNKINFLDQIALDLGDRSNYKPSLKEKVNHRLRKLLK